MPPRNLLGANGVSASAVAAKTAAAYLGTIKALGFKFFVVYRIVFGIIVLLLAFLHLGTAR
jgi:undecaprenyl pyrophosphate phosphatase UppP